MSSAETSTNDPLPSTSPPNRLTMADKWLGLGLANEAMMMRDREQLLRNERLTVAWHRSQYLGQPMPNEDGDEMIHIGDINHHQHQENPPSSPPAPASGLSSFAKLAIGGAIAATGIGMPLGGYFIADALKSFAKPAASVVAPVNPGAGYDLKILDE